jgi:hypothetical protein
MKGVRAAADNHSSREGAAAPGEKYPASLRIKAAGEVVNCGRDVASAHGGKRESCGATGVSDRDPARGQLPPDRRIGVARVRELDDVQVVADPHGPTVSRGDAIPRSLAAADLSGIPVRHGVPISPGRPDPNADHPDLERHLSVVIRKVLAMTVPAPSPPGPTTPAAPSSLSPSGPPRTMLAASNDLSRLPAWNTPMPYARTVRPSRDPRTATSHEPIAPTRIR